MSVPVPTNVLGAMTQAQTVVLVGDLFTQPPVLEVSYLAGSLHEIELRLPCW